MSTPDSTPKRTHPLAVVTFAVLGVGAVVTLLLLLLPMNAAAVGALADSTCGSVLVNDDPNYLLGEAACADALETRRNQAIVVALVTVVAAAGLGLARLWQADNERWAAKAAAERARD